MGTAWQLLAPTGDENRDTDYQPSGSRFEQCCEGSFDFIARPQQMNLQLASA
jgi:hypothetical protein